MEHCYHAQTVQKMTTKIFSSIFQNLANHTKLIVMQSKQLPKIC